MAKNNARKTTESKKGVLQGNRIFSFVKDLSFDALNTLRWCRHNFRLNLKREVHFAENSPYPPVILLQGFMGSSGVLKPLEKYLNERNWNVILLDLGYFNIRDIRESAERLLYEVERILDQYSDRFNFKQVDIVAHSMGGLIALYYIKQLGGHRLVRKLVSLGTPFRGTWAAILGIAAFGLFSKGIWQLHPRSDFLKKLRSDFEHMNKVEILSIAAQYDSLIPPESCFLKGANNRILPLGHAGLIMDERVFEAVQLYLSSGKTLPDPLAFSHFPA